MSHDKPQPAKQSTAPSSESVLWGEWRRGLKDLQDVVLNAFPQGTVAKHEELGTIANPTQLEVNRDKDIDRDDFNKQLDRAASRGDDPERGRSR